MGIKKFKEITSEVLASNYTNPTRFTTEFIELLKELAV